MIDFYHIIAARKAGDLEGWTWCTLQVLSPTKDVLVEGGVPTEKIKRGPRKGETKWDGVPLTTIVVTHAELQAERKDYEATTGNCHLCGGEGKTLVGWSKADGDWCRTCGRCGGIGKAPAPAVASTAQESP